MEKKSLQFKFDMNCRFAIYVPSTYDVSKKTNPDFFRNRVISELASLFGGATSTPAKGGWICSDGKLVVEDIEIVYAFCTTQEATEKFDKVLAICEWLKKEMKQEAISLEYNGQLNFI